jgi:hypothetical protein
MLQLGVEITSLPCKNSVVSKRQQRRSEEEEEEEEEGHIHQSRVFSSGVSLSLSTIPSFF